MKDVDRRRDIDDDRENTNGDDRKGSFTHYKGLGKFYWLMSSSRRRISHPRSRRARYRRVDNFHGHASYNFDSGGL